MMASWELAETPLPGRHGNPSAPWKIAATITIYEPLITRGRNRLPQDIRRKTMDINQGKRITREEKRRRQRIRANLIGLALVAALVAAGLILGLTAGVSL